MKRDLEKLAKAPFDVIVVGGGVYGSFIAWDAALRGLSVALIDKGDFASGASSHSLKTIHGGLRYLQQFDFGRMRASVRERSAMLRIAPHLVKPLPCLMPTSGGLSFKSKEIVRIAMMISDLIAFDRNRGLSEERQIPSCAILSGSDCEKIIPGFSGLRATGAALWTDAQVLNSERLIIDVIRAAVLAGTTAANYVRMERYLVEKGRAVGIAARDLVTGRELSLSGSLVINAAGSWIPSIFTEGGAPVSFRHKPLVGGYNLVLNRQLLSSHGLGVRSKKGGESRLYFLVPWKNVTLIGTEYRNIHGSPDDFEVTDEDVDDFIERINGAYPAAKIRPADISYVHRGVLPAKSDRIDDAGKNVLGSFKIVDHADEGVEGMLTVLGVKYTTARDVAERTVDLALKKLARPHRKSGTAATILPRAEERGGGDLTEARIEHAVREEMAMTLEDLLLRRLESGVLGCPDRGSLENCAKIMGADLEWDEPRMAEEIQKVERFYYHRRRQAVE